MHPTTQACCAILEKPVDPTRQNFVGVLGVLRVSDHQLAISGLVTSRIPKGHDREWLCERVAHGASPVNFQRSRCPGREQVTTRPKGTEACEFDVDEGPEIRDILRQKYL